MVTNKDIADKLKFAAKIIDKNLKYKAFVNDIPTLAFGIVYKNKLIYHNEFEHKNKNSKINEKSCFRIASISKIFTAIAIMQLVEKGELSLDDKAFKYLPWFNSSKDKNVAFITIRELLTHTSGLTRDGNTPHWTNFQFPSIEQIKEYVINATLIYEPNDKWKYSNFGYTILGQIIESVSKKSYEEYVRDNIFAKIAMTNTSSDINTDISSSIVTGYGMRFPNKDREIFPQIKTNSMAPATGFVSNVADLTKFISAQFKGNNKLLTEESKKELRRIQWLRDNEDLHQAIGFQMWKMLGKTIYSHTGGLQGYKSAIAMDFERQIGVIVLMNVIDEYPLSYARMAFHTINYVLSHWNEFIDNKIKESELLKYEGTFMNIWGGIESMVVNKRLVLFYTGSGRPLIGFNLLSHKKDNTFLAVTGDSFGSVGQEIKFEFDNKGKVTRLIEEATPSGIFEY